MSQLNKQSEKEMIDYIELLIKNAIYCYGTNTLNSLHLIASHLVSNGCRINIGKRRRQLLKDDFTK